MKINKATIDLSYTSKEDLKYLCDKSGYVNNEIEVDELDKIIIRLKETIAALTSEWRAANRNPTTGEKV